MATLILATTVQFQIQWGIWGGAVSQDASELPTSLSLKGLKPC